MPPAARGTARASGGALRDAPDLRHGQPQAPCQLRRARPVRAHCEEKFVTLAERRVDNAIGAISRVGNLANRNAYEYGDADVKKIVQTLEAEVTSVKARFAAPKGRRTERIFKL